MEKEVIHSAIENLSNSIENLETRIIASCNTKCNYTIHINGIEFLCEVRRNITTSNFGTLLNQLKSIQETENKPLLLIAQSIYPSLMRELSKNNINVIDIAGNCQININNLFLHIEGKKTNSTSKAFFCVSKSPKARLFQDAGIKVIFRLLENPECVNLPYRQIQKSTNVSLGSINIIMKELINSGYILKTDNGKFLKNKHKLFERWVVEYNEIIKPKLFIERMTFKNSAIKSDWKNITLPLECYWGGEAAANIYDGYLIPELYSIYGGERGALVKAGLRPKNDGEIMIYKSFLPFSNETKTTPLLLTYADLMGSGISRNIEAAQRIYSNEIQNLK